MTARTNHWKLGLFVCTGLAVGLGALVWLGASTLYQEKERMHVLLDESVAGLDVGSSVRFRGVPLGTVADIRFAQDQSTVIVDIDMFLDAITSAGLHRRKPGEAGAFAAQLTSSGITGGKYLAIDAFPEGRYPRVPLPATLPDDVLPDMIIPSVASNLKNLEEKIYDLADSLPKTFSEVKALIANLSQLTDTVDDLASGEVRDVLVRLVEQVEQVDLGRISSGVATTLDEAGPALRSMREAVERVGGESGSVPALAAEAGLLVRELRAALAAADAGTLSGEALLLGDDVRRTLTDLRSTLDDLSRLLELLEREPGSLLRGRADPTSAPRSP